MQLTVTATAVARRAPKANLPNDFWQHR